MQNTIIINKQLMQKLRLIINTQAAILLTLIVSDQLTSLHPCALPVPEQLAQPPYEAGKTWKGELLRFTVDIG